MKWVIFVIATILVFAILRMGLVIAEGEILWIAYFVVIPFIVARLCGRWKVVTAASAMVLTLHFCGYKIYGRPTTFEVPGLKNPEVIVAIKPPNILIMKDGTERVLTGYVIFKEADLSRDPSELRVVEGRKSVLSPEGEAAARIWHAKFENHKGEWGLPAEFSKTPQGTIQATTLQRIHYWCGNTWFPTFFPKNLPRSRRLNVGELLVQAEVAKAEDSATSNKRK